MPNKRIAMRKIHEILRLRFEVGLSFRQISQCADVSTGAIQKMLKRLEATGIPWPLPEGMSEPRLASLLYPESDSLNRPGFFGEFLVRKFRLPDHYFHWKHNRLFRLLPAVCGLAVQVTFDY